MLNALSATRNLTFSEKVNDIVFESGNSLYQPILDRYIAGEGPEGMAQKRPASVGSFGIR